MKSTGLAALALAVALPAGAQDAKPTEGVIDASFTWSVVDLASLPAGEAEERARERGAARDHRQRAGAVRPAGRPLPVPVPA